MRPVDYKSLHPLLFRLEPEDAHNLTLSLLAFASKIPPVRRWVAQLFECRDPRLESDKFGMRFRNPVGIAAGYDKNAIAVHGLAALGAGHVEVGTITLNPQRGSPRPRVFRLPEDRALINRMGFPNDGVATVAPRLAQLRTGPMAARLGVNIGKGRDTPVEDALSDYGELLRKVYLSADYVVVNLSSPNTPGLRQLQVRDALEDLLAGLMELRVQVCPHMPVLLKIAPDLSLAEVDDMLTAISSYRISGVIATNTTVSREGLRNAARAEKGGLSGAPLRAHATEIIRHIYRQTGGTLPIIGVGGVTSAATALEKICAGACLVQVYTGLVYAGPELMLNINVGLLRELAKLGMSSVEELVGNAE
ncbi:MAG: quinone-dependent dihydroorotate dehydrogenase [Anaerolineales bacterium]|jgi:dihydroorotate dehydrogenase|nr:quinone-dependent dihydroorotate dehydrogenase [Anaerolineales bacterium]